MSNLNSVNINGRIPNFDPIYNKGTENGKKSFLSWSLSVKRAFKPEGEQYYPEDLIRFKAFAAKADFIYNNFKAQDGMIIKGRIQKDEDYTGTDGIEKKGQLFVLVEDTYFADAQRPENKGKSNGNKNAPAAPSAPAGRPTGRPGTRPGAPGARPGAPGRPGAR